MYVVTVAHGETHLNTHTHAAAPSPAALPSVSLCWMVGRTERGVGHVSAPPPHWLAGVERNVQQVADKTHVNHALFVEGFIVVLESTFAILFKVNSKCIRVQDVLYPGYMCLI